MSNGAVANRLLIAGTLIKEPEIRISPAGIPIARFILKHESRQIEADMQRQVACTIGVVASGEGLKRVVEQLGIGSRVRISGFINQAGYRSQENRLVLHAEQIQPE